MAAMPQSQGSVDRGRRSGPDEVGAELHIPAAVVLGQGDLRAVTLLLLRDLRTASLVLVVFGLAVPLLLGQLDESSAESLSTPGGLFRSVFTPFALLALGIGLRLLVGPLAYMLALEVVVRGRSAVISDASPAAQRSHVWDKLRLASGYRSLRWTTVVKEEAIARLGRRGRILDRAEIVLRILIGLGVVVVIVIAAAAS